MTGSARFRILPWAVAPFLAGGLYSRWSARRAERAHPPVGRFLDVDGVRLHYVDRGRGIPVVLLHGNAALLNDFGVSILPRLARRYRVIAFDRPGYGYSSRPRDRIWTPARQAALFAAALDRLGVRRPVLVGHSWGATTALAHAQAFGDAVRAAVLISGFYFPVPSLPLRVMGAAAAPLAGPLFCHTVLPPLGRALLPWLRQSVFAPNPVPRSFAAFPAGLVLRPGHIRTAAEEDRILRPATADMAPGYGRVRVPLVIMAGDSDRLVSWRRHSLALHRRVPDAVFRLVAGAGHMVHHVHGDAVVAAVDEAVARSMADPPPAAEMTGS